MVALYVFIQIHTYLYTLTYTTHAHLYTYLHVPAHTQIYIHIYIYFKLYWFYFILAQVAWRHLYPPYLAIQGSLQLSIVYSRHKCQMSQNNSSILATTPCLKLSKFPRPVNNSFPCWKPLFSLLVFSLDWNFLHYFLFQASMGFITYLSLGMQ